MAETKSKNQYWVGVGRRKSSVALVRIFENSNVFTINDKAVEPIDLILAPFELVGKKGSFGTSVKVKGGGKMSQAEAIRHGISRALEHFDNELRPTLKKAGFLTRDQREKERKKPGLKRARRAPQWSKR